MFLRDENSLLQQHNKLWRSSFKNETINKGIFCFLLNSFQKKSAARCVHGSYWRMSEDVKSLTTIPTCSRRKKEKEPLKTTDSTSTSVRQGLNLAICAIFNFVIYPAISKQYHTAEMVHVLQCINWYHFEIAASLNLDLYTEHLRNNIFSADESITV